MRNPVFAMCEQHPRSLISAFVVRCLDSIIPLLSVPEISSLYQTSVAVQAGLSLTLVANPDRFSRDETRPVLGMVQNL